jgi:hypothetical protein
LINCFVAELRVRIVARKNAGGRASPALPATTKDPQGCEAGPAQTKRAAILAAETHEWVIHQSPSVGILVGRGAQPTARIYELTLERLGIEANRAAFLDDLEDNVVGSNP